ncbi:MAG: hypothetical protein QG671_2843 [Actinomycetota bacterium]|nr:hypothetical protein [Actinomycetota bacterium]
MTVASEGPGFCLREVPFSFFGSWLDLSYVIAERTVAEDVHLVSHQTGFHPVLRLVPVMAGDRVEVSVGATPARLRWEHERGWIEAVFETADTLRVAGQGLGLSLLASGPELTAFTGSYFFRDPTTGAYVFTSYETGRRYRVTVLHGSRAIAIGAQSLGEAERGLVIGAEPGDWEVAVEELGTARSPYRPERNFDEVRIRAARAFGGFLDAVAPWRDATTPAAALAAYVLWSATVHPAGMLRRTSVLMSKHWMDKVWSWDHCFNALALTGLPELAWDQFRVPFDHQDPSGALPDSVTHSEILCNFVKPPVHGWALHRLRACLSDPEPEDLREIYRRMAGWTRFWLDARRTPSSGLAHYQHGNDSGWDNATTFDPERFIESADLAAFLVLQLDELAVLATALALPDEAADWDRASQAMMTTMIGRLWDGERFVARGVESGRTWASSSLLDLMPIVLGERLPPEVRKRLVTRLADHLTDHGLATEDPDSIEYQDDGYWRGPIWAPATVLIEDGLRRAGEPDLADGISDRFRNLCETSGFAENFDARSGAGLRDRAYTWTASAYLILAAAHRTRRAASANGPGAP